MGSVPDKNSGTASGINNAVTRVAGLVAVAAMGTVAAIIYGRAGGPQSFGAFGSEPDHVDATISAFQGVCWTISGMAAAAALVALIWVKKPADQASSSASQ